MLSSQSKAAVFTHLIINLRSELGFTGEIQLGEDLRVDPKLTAGITHPF